MKIGIITYHCVCNFGAQLQAISTVGSLKRKGHEPVVIHWYPQDLDDRYRREISPEQYNAHILFAEQNMPLTKLCRTEDDLLQIIDNNNIDAIILGSDALFKYMPLADRKIFSKRKLKFIEKQIESDQEFVQNPFWGYFIPRLKKQIPVAVFSVSSQNAPYYLTDKQEYNELKRLLSQFKYITVRDEWTKEMVEYFSGNRNVPVTPDPVFSFNQNTYLRVPDKTELLEKYNLPDNYVLLSFRLNHINSDFIKNTACELETKGYAPVAFPTPKGLNNNFDGLKFKINTPLFPSDWYYLIKYSSGYVGELMHPVVVAIHNAVPFFSFDEYGVYKDLLPCVSKYNLPIISKYKRYIKESGKIYHILSMVNLLENRVSYPEGSQTISPQEVVKKLFSADTNKIKCFSDSYQKYYEKSIDELLQHIEINKA